MLPTLRRVGVSVGAFIVIIAVNFLIPRLMPGSPIKAIASGGDPGELTPAEKAALLARYGLDKPLWEQFTNYLVGLTRGDLGISLSDGRPVTEHVGERLSLTLWLVGTALVITTVLGVLLAARFTLSRKESTDTGGLTVSIALDALPAFWVGMILILAFGVHLGWLPTFGARSIVGGGGLWDRARHLVLPVATLVITGLGQTYMVSRSALLNVAGSTHVQHARIRGIPERTVKYRHVLRASALPIHTLVMLEVGWLIGGAVVVETVFGYPGLGRLIFDAVTARDYPVLQGAFLLMTLTVIAANLIADVTYPLLDPRVRQQGGSS